MSFATDLQRQLDRLSAAGWNRDEIAKPTGYTDRQIRGWANGASCKPALRIGLLAVLKNLKRPPGKSNSKAQPCRASL